MISPQLDRSATPHVSNSRPDISLELPSFSSSVSTSTASAIIAPKPFRPDPSDRHLALSQQSGTAPSTPSPPPLEPNVSYSRSFAQGVPVPSIPDVSLEIYVDDEGLSSVEKIYLFCRSTTTWHRVFISRSLHTFLSGVSPLEGVEYVLPLLNNLAVDDEDAVKEALVSGLVDVMWWFFENCQLVEDEPPEEQADPPLLPVQTFTPILGSLLIDHSTMVGAPARFAIVEILNRLHAADDRCEDSPPFGSRERKMLEQEIVHQVIIGMGRLDVSEENFPSPISKPELPPALSSTASSSSSTNENALISSSLPPEPHPLSLSIVRPEAPHVMTETHAAQVTSPATSCSAFLCTDILSGPAPPLSQEQTPHVPLGSSSLPSQENRCVNGIRQHDQPNSEVIISDTASKSFKCEDQAWLSQDTQDEANEQAAMGRLSSMSLIATVTAHAKLPEDTVRAFADEVAYIGGDPLYWVRREASFAVGALAKIVPMEVVLLSLLPLFENLARDSVCQVRHSAVFALPGILTRLTPQHRRTLALNILLPLSVDVALTVRSGVLEVLGEVIYAFHEDKGGAPPELVSLFVGREQGSEWSQVMDGTEPRQSDLSTPRAKTSSEALLSVFESDDDSPEKSEKREAVQVGESAPSETSMTTPGHFFPDPARSLITSFNYPAVVLSLGSRRWGEVREHYLMLTRDRNPHVRRTIAAGLGEMARILGSELALRDLVNVWQDMVHDLEDGLTRLKALRGICLFVGALEGKARDPIVAELGKLWDKWLMGWRERECLTQALPTLAVLAERQGEVIRTLMGKALADKMAAVREAAVGALTHLFRAFESRPHHAEALRDDLQGLASMDSCRRRATYVACCLALAEGELGKIEVARNGFWNHIFPLIQDRVIDVRIGVARLISVVCEKFYPHPSTRPSCLMEVIRRLSQDPSRDVRAFVAFVSEPEEVGQLRQNPTTPLTPSKMFATFSRPPPKPSSAIVRMDTQEIGSVDEDSRMKNQSHGHLPCVPEREADQLMSQNKQTGEGMQGDMVAAEDPFKPPPLPT